MYQVRLHHILVLSILWSFLWGNEPCSAQTNQATTGTLFGRVENDHARMRNAFNRLFVQADKPYQFLGEPSVATLKMPGKDESFDYYLVAIPFNVPMIKKNLSFHYKYVRLDGRLKVIRPLKLGQNAEFFRIKVLSIYPTNSSINAMMQSTHTLEETLQPQWAGASAGSIHNANTDVLSYQMQLPTMAGITAPLCTTNGENSGTVAELRWTVYPAKKQQIMVGDRLGLALVAVEKLKDKTAEDNRKFWFNGYLSYALTLGPPFSTSRYEETWETPLNTAGTLKQLLAAHALDFPSADVAKMLNDVFEKSDKDTKYSVSRINRNRAAIFEANSGDVQEIGTAGLTQLPSFSKRWETKVSTDQVWNLVTARDADQKTIVCRCTVVALLATFGTTDIQRTIKLKDSTGKSPDKTIVLCCVDQSQDAQLQERKAIYEGTSVFAADDDFEKYDNWEPVK